MANPDFLIYAAHGLFWTSFGISKLLSKSPADMAPPVRAPRVDSEVTAPHSRTLVMFHALAFAVMYFGVGNTVIPNRVPAWFQGQRLVGVLVIAAGAAIMSWALFYFKSWRFRAQLDAGHELATGGPFHYVRHPLYLGLDLLAIGTAIWVPTMVTWIGALLMVIGSDLRGRAEEKLLTQGFGTVYTDYCGRTKRFVPGVY